jgi:hypothetical protein
MSEVMSTQNLTMKHEAKAETYSLRPKKNVILEILVQIIQEVK